MQCCICPAPKKYKCSKCVSPYCSIACYKIHQSNCSKQGSKLDSGSQFDQGGVDEEIIKSDFIQDESLRLQPAKLALLSQSEEIKKLLKSQSLKKQLLAIDNTSFSHVKLRILPVLHSCQQYPPISISKFVILIFFTSLITLHLAHIKLITPYNFIQLITQNQIEMGNSQLQAKVNTGILQYINDEFQRVKKDKKRKHLTISQLLQINAHEDYPFDFRHLAILFICDHTSDGIFTLADLEHFASWIQLNLAAVQMYEFKSQLQARTMSKFIEFMEKKDGQSTIIAWFIRMLIEDQEKKVMRGNTYIKIDAIKLIYEIFNIRIMTDINIQSFFFLIKRSSEDLGYPIEEIKDHEEDQEFQEYIEVTVCKEFLRCFLKGAVKILKEIGYNNSII